VQKKFDFHLRRRAVDGSDPERRHADFFRRVALLDRPWGSHESPVPPLDPFGVDVASVTSLTRWFGSPVVRALLTYRYPRLLEDDELYDDWLSVVMNVAKMDMEYALFIAIPCYIEAFGAYLVELYCEGATAIESARYPGAHINFRRHARFIGPVNYFDEILCQRAFHMTPREVYERFDGRIEHVRIINNGVYLVGTSQVLPLEESVQVGDHMKALLGYRRPGDPGAAA